jgi:hypothetical protein
MNVLCVCVCVCLFIKKDGFCLDTENKEIFLTYNSFATY